MVDVFFGQHRKISRSGVDTLVDCTNFRFTSDELSGLIVKM